LPPDAVDETNADDLAADDDPAIDRGLEARRAADHRPFRAAFVDWLGEASARFAQPVSARAASPVHTELDIAGLHPALAISLCGGSDINVFVEWQDVSWDIIACFDNYSEQAPDGAGWYNKLFLPEFQRLHPTRAACWRADGFEHLLEWVNNDLQRATHLALIRMGGMTVAELLCDGFCVRTGRPFVIDRYLRDLLPVHGVSHGPVYTSARIAAANRATSASSL
jgi:hypothetical protein